MAVTRSPALQSGSGVNLKRQRAPHRARSGSGSAVSTACDLIVTSVAPVPSRSRTSSRRSSLPVGVCGSSVRKTTSSGVREPRSRARAYSLTSSPSSLGAGLGDDDRDDPGAPLLVGHPDHGDLLDRGVRDEHVLDLGRGDVLAAADDRVVGPARDEQVAVGVEPALVAGGEPAVGRRARTRRRGTRRTPGCRAPRARPACAGRQHRAVARPRIWPSTPGTGRPAEPSRSRTAGSRGASAARWSSGPSTAIVELVSVSP